jgi:hypothetical protein
MKPQSRPAAMKRSYIPYVTDAVVSGKARIETLTGKCVVLMADPSGFLPKWL